MEIFRPGYGVKIGIFHLAGATLAGSLISAIGLLFLMKPGSIHLLVSRDAEAKQLALGRSIHASQCASCHGKNLEGQPNWKTRLPSGRLPAPPHDASGHTWHHADQVLVGVTKNGLKAYAGGNYESDMPAFGGRLSDEEIESVIAYIKSTWPERERQYQERITVQNQPQQ